jgi:hypothetical protein
VPAVDESDGPTQSSIGVVVRLERGQPSTRLDLARRATAPWDQYLHQTRGSPIQVQSGLRGPPPHTGRPTGGSTDRLTTGRR